jgi:hypothetical protein
LCVTDSECLLEVSRSVEEDTCVCVEEDVCVSLTVSASSRSRAVRRRILECVWRRMLVCH